MYYKEMKKKKPQIKLVNHTDNNIRDLKAKIRQLETMIYKMANDIDLSSSQLITLAQILDKRGVLK